MGDAFGPRSRRSGRAATRLAGFATSIAIALAGCAPDRFAPEAVASATQYDTIGMIASGYGAAQGLAKTALSDGILTNAEYDQVIAVDKAETAEACSYAKAMLADIALGELSSGFRPDMWWACETGMIVAHDYGGASYADIVAGRQPSPYAIASGIKAPSGVETGNTVSTEGESAAPKGETHNE